MCRCSPGPKGTVTAGTFKPDGQTFVELNESPGETMADKDPERSKCVTEAMMKMTGLDIAALRHARETQ